MFHNTDDGFQHTGTQTDDGTNITLEIATWTIEQVRPQFLASHKLQRYAGRRVTPSVSPLH